MNSLPASGIGRPIDVSYPSNRFVAVVSPAAGVIAGAVALVSGESLGRAALTGAVVGAAVFLAWATGRELDPDRPWTAGVAAVVAGLLAIAGRPALGQTALLMLAARILTRSTGLAPTLVDRVVVVAGSGYVASTSGGFPLVLVAAGMVVAGGYLYEDGTAASWVTGAAVAAAGVAGAALGDGWVIDPTSPDGGGWAAGGVAVLALVGLLRRPRVTVAADHSSRAIGVGAVWLARAGVALGAAGAALWSGGEAVVGLGPVWAALAASASPDRPRGRAPSRRRGPGSGTPT